MKKIIIPAAILTAAAASAGVGATTNWVARFVESRVSEIEKNLAITQTASGAATNYELPDGGSVSAQIEEPTVGGIVCRDLSLPATRAGGITNGMVFAWNGTAYQNGEIVITATKTNLVFGSWSSTRADGRFYLANGDDRLCRVQSTILQPTVAQKIIEGK